jgi:hypothetical protein
MYLQSRNVPAPIVTPHAPLPPPDLALAIHSWTECTLQAVKWWLAKLQAWRTPYLMIASGEPELLTWEGPSMKPALEAAGYTRLKAAGTMWPSDAPMIRSNGFRTYYLFTREP